MTTVVPGDVRKPDPSEPWRYVCPECHGQVHGSQRHRLYRCGSCGVSWAKDELYDAKLDE